MGRQHALLYECDRCHRLQRIPHPMWRYQTSPDSFGDTSWACHVGCGAFTRWRVAPRELHLVPLHDVPGTWPQYRQYLDGIRSEREVHGAEEEEREEDDFVGDGLLSCVIS